MSFFALGIASALGSYINNKSNQKFQQKMSDTAHQREVNDLRAAGLNPILSAGGSGASVPTYASEDPISKGIEAYNSAKLIKAQSKELETKADANSAGAENSRADTLLKIQQTATEKAKTRLTDLQSDKTLAETVKVKKEAEQYLPALINKIEQDIRTGRATEAERRALANYHIVGAQTMVDQVQIAMYDAQTRRMDVNQRNQLILAQISNLNSDSLLNTQAYYYRQKFPTGIITENGSLGIGPGGLNVSSGKQMYYIPR